MADEANKVQPLPGTGVVGRGIYIKPHQPYVLKDYLFDGDGENVFHSVETGKSFSVPGGYAVNDSPPMPTNRMLNQTVIEESQEHFDKQMGVDANVAAGIGAFSIDAQSSQSKHLRSTEDAYYALRTSFIPLWTVYLPNLSGLSETAFHEAKLPEGRFDHKHRREYERFFARYGTHYVRRAWVGGKATLVFIVAKSSGLSKEGIQAGIKASYTGIGSADLKKELNEEKENLQKNSECQIFGKGGDEIQLASLSSLDEAAYNTWVGTIKQNPQVIELDVMGIWSLLPDPQAQALQDAYRAETVFRRISGMFSIGEQIFIVRGNTFFYYDIKTRVCSNPIVITDYFKVLKDTPFERVDAALETQGLKKTARNAGSSPTREDLDARIFIFREKECTRIDYKNSKIDEGYPKKIVEDWPGVTFERIDAAIGCGADAIYFFSGNQYVRFNMDNNQVDEGYPKKIATGWPGVTFDRIDAALYWADGKVYFFREDEYIRFDMTLYRADPGYPKPIVGEYVEDWKFFD